ncbi:pyridoxal phosphate-dependent aminotransferase [Streptomyces sp. TRM49041]|uniref:pyridoxal phosphate-dependent aminotransferase n=1 Tax=Streptomyces sp. TRM49041 TaxID=2603216 RepID=UPI0011EE3713|nr:pyridoxal phosphate-dependent aminotransferase [Streptomyces sp. TRM49041]
MPSFGRPLTEIRPSPLVAVEQLLRTHGHETPVGLHQGKTVFTPCAIPRPWERDEFGIAAHEHAPPAGVPALRGRLADAAAARRGTPVDTDQVLVTGGATHAIAVTLHAVLRPGDDVLVLSPQWLFATGLVRAAGGVPREIPVFLELSQDPGFDFTAVIEAAVGPRTRAIYFNNPNNPTGFRLDEDQLARLADLAERHDLWLIADNAYENYDFSPDGFLDPATVGRAAERTFSVHSCSKTYAMPGARVGHLISPPGCGDVLTKWSLHTLYSVSTAAQFAAYEALATPPEELAARRARAADAWRLADDTLEIPHTSVSGGLYTFLDLRALGDGEEFIRRCAREGVGLAPGRVFGEHCTAWARVCFTAAPPAAVRDAIHRINKIYWEGVHER